MDRNIDSRTVNHSISTSEIEIDSLNLEDLDVEELENRLELSAGNLQAVPCIVVLIWEA